MVFDALPGWLARSSQRRRLGEPGGYRPPPWTWGIDRREQARIARTPNVVALRELPMPPGRGPLFGHVLPALGRLPRLHPSLVRILVARFGDAVPAAGRTRPESGEGNERTTHPVRREVTS